MKNIEIVHMMAAKRLNVPLIDDVSSSGLSVLFSINAVDVKVYIVYYKFFQDVVRVTNEHIAMVHCTLNSDEVLIVVIESRASVITAGDLE